MTVIASAPPTPAISAISHPRTAPLQWRSSARDAWEGRRGRGIAGSVKKDGVDYLAIDERGQLLGRFDSLVDAEDAVVSLAASLADRIRYTRVMATLAAVSGAAALLAAAAGFVVLTL